jgi:hypothetical protein
LEHERELLVAMVMMIFDASKVSDAPAIVLRTGEATGALMSALALILAVSPSAARSPTAIRRTVKEFGKGLRWRVAEAGQNVDLQDLVRRFLLNPEVGGNA